MGFIGLTLFFFCCLIGRGSGCPLVTLHFLLVVPIFLALLPLEVIARFTDFKRKLPRGGCFGPKRFWWSGMTTYLAVRR